MTSLTFLDHSSAFALVADLKRYIGCVEALKTVVLENPPSVSLPWTLLDVGRGILPSDWHGPDASPFSLWARSVFQGRYSDYCMLLCDGFGLNEPFLTGGPGLGFRLAACSPPQGGGGSSADDSQRDRLNDNLRGVFA